MAIKQFYAGSIGPFSYDDASYNAFQTDGKVVVQGAPVDPDDVVRLADVDQVAFQDWFDQAVKTTSSPQFANLTLTGSIVQEAWNAAGFQNSWVNYDGTHNPAGYYIDKEGVVHLRGRIKNGTIAATVFQLPAGYRPPYTEYHTAGGSATPTEVSIDSSGNVVVAVGTNTWVSLDGITFRAA